MKTNSKPIKDYVIGIYDGPHATPKESNDGPVFLGIKNITEDGHLDLSDIKHISAEEFPKWTRRVTPLFGDVVFSYEATLHRYALIPEGFNGCLGRRLALVRPDPEKLDSRFLLCYFLSQNWRAVVESSIISGATVDRIPLERFPLFPTMFPDITTQRRIADILSAYDDMIENNQRRMRLLEKAARMIYQEWFVRLRFPGHETARIVDGVPEGWEKRRLGDILSLKYGKALKAPDRQGGAIPVYGSSGVVGFHDKALTDGPGIIVGRKGNAGSVFWSDTNFWPIDTAFYVASEESDYFVYHNLQCQPFISSDVAVPGLNRDYAHGLPLVLPAPGTRDLFDEVVTPMYEQMWKLRDIYQKLQQARDILLPKLMSGEIDLSETAADLELRSHIL